MKPRRKSSILVELFSLLLSPLERRGMTHEEARAFYRSPEWKALRYAALKKHGARCQCCGTTARLGARIVVDHIKPIRRYRHLRLRLSNLQVLCDPCNIGKGSTCTKDWRPQ